MWVVEEILEKYRNNPTHKPINMGEGYPEACPEGPYTFLRARESLFCSTSTRSLLLD